MKKILVFSNTSFSIEKFRYHYLSKSKKYYFKIYTPSAKRFEEYKKENIEHKNFEANNIYSAFTNVRNILRKENPHSIIVYSTYYIFILSLLKITHNYNLISIIAGRGSLFYEGSNFKIFFLKKVFNFFLNFSEKIVFINPGDLNFFCKKSKLIEKSYLLPTEGLEKINYNIKINKKKNFIFFARLIFEKGIIDYLSVAKKIITKYPNCNFYIAGPISKVIVGQSKTRKIWTLLKKNRKYVKYLGYIKDYKKIFHKIDCLIAPSKLEGAGTSVMEAMQSGLFVIAYNNTGHNYVLKNTGNIICKNNNSTDLEKNIENFFDYNDKKLTNIAKNSYKRIADNFESKIISKKFIKILEKPNYVIKKKKFFIKLIYNFFLKPRELNTSKKNVVHITRYFDHNKRFGGIEEVIKQIAFHSKFKHQVLAISDNEKKLKIANNLTSFTFKKTLSFFNDLFSIGMFKFLLKNKKNYNIIHIHYPSVLAYLYIFLLPFKKNIIVTHHSDIERLKILKIIVSPFLYYMHRYVNYFHISSKTYFKNSEIKKYFLKTTFEYFSIIKPKIKHLKLNLKFKKYVLFISRKSYYKGLDKLEKLIEINPNVNFICVTNYEFTKNYKNLIQFNNINENFKYNLVKNCRLIISTSTSRAESFGMTLIEGLFFSKPLMGFDLKTGLNEIILDKNNGYLVKKFDINNYSKRLKKIYFSDFIYKKFSLNSKKHIKNFNQRYEKINELYNQLD